MLDPINHLEAVCLTLRASAGKEAVRVHRGSCTRRALPEYDLCRKGLRPRDGKFREESPLDAHLLSYAECRATCALARAQETELANLWIEEGSEIDQNNEFQGPIQSRLHFRSSLSLIEGSQQKTTRV